MSLLQMTEDEFRERFRNSPVKRAKLVGLQRNACVALGNAGSPAAIPALVRALREGESLVRGHAAWALGRIGGVKARQELESALPLEEEPETREEIGSALAGGLRSVPTLRLPAAPFQEPQSSPAPLREEQNSLVLLRREQNSLALLREEPGLSGTVAGRAELSGPVAEGAELSGAVAGRAELSGPVAGGSRTLWRCFGKSRTLWLCFGKSRTLWRCFGKSRTLRHCFGRSRVLRHCFRNRRALRRCCGKSRVHRRLRIERAVGVPVADRRSPGTGLESPGPDLPHFLFDEDKVSLRQ